MPKSCKSSRGTALYLTSAHSGELLVPFIVHLRWINYRDKVFSSVRTDLEVEQMINKFSINLSRDSPFLLPELACRYLRRIPLPRLRLPHFTLSIHLALVHLFRGYACRRGPHNELCIKLLAVLHRTESLSLHDISVCNKFQRKSLFDWAKDNEDKLYLWTVRYLYES